MRLLKCSLTAMVLVSAGCNYHIPSDSAAQDGMDVDGVSGTGGSGGSGGSGGGGFALVPAFQYLGNNLFKQRCVACHNSGRSAAGIDLSSHRSLMAARNRSGAAAVVAGNAAGSLVVQVIESGIMPPSGADVDPKVVAILKCWIDQGAPADGAFNCLPENASRPGDTGGTGGGTTSPVDPGNPPPPSPPPFPPGSPVTFATVFSQVLEPWCVGCHAGPDGAHGIDLSSWESIMSGRDDDDRRADEDRRAFAAVAVGLKRPLVSPGDPERSKIWHVVEENQMPYQLDPLTDDLKQILRQWILDGAKP